jgi:decaprenylphospho-beta-D-ribofuranose 2-oxidase
MRVNYRRVANLAEIMDATLQTSAAPTYSVAWIDCVASGEKQGRSVLIEAEHAKLADLSGRKAKSPLKLPRPGKKSVPFNFPGFVLNSHSVGWFNALYYRMHPSRSDVITSYEPFFYPLDGVKNWNRIYGRRGFIQYQALLPLETSREGIPKLLDEIVRSRLASFLAVLKRTGYANAGMLSFCKPGVTLALDLPNAGTSLRELAGRLDRILLDHGGRLYLAKDSVTTPETIAAMYPELERFREIKRQADPRGKFTSAQAKRLGILG